jgi:hypothetical protein
MNERRNVMPGSHILKTRSRDKYWKQILLVGMMSFLLLSFKAVLAAGCGNGVTSCTNNKAGTFDTCSMNEPCTWICYSKDLSDKACQKLQCTTACYSCNCDPNND